jgi:hypothetical protein
VQGVESLRIDCRVAQRLALRVRAEIMGSQKCGNVGKSQSVHTMFDPTRTGVAACGAGAAGIRDVARRARVAAAVTGLLVGAATVVFVS